ncbi:MAG: hypothetical protein JKX78_14260 [Alteromonadaceae bacterium]|nr:hypothetical protein [Alteromonadaceae bacterium]
MHNSTPTLLPKSPTPCKSTKRSKSSSRSAIIYQSLYLANLLLIPLLAFFVLLYFLWGGKPQSRFTHIHLIRAIQISALAGLLLIAIPLFIVYFSPQFETSLMVIIFYFVTLHAGFVLIGMLNLARAMAKKLPLF